MWYPNVPRSFRSRFDNGRKTTRRGSLRDPPPRPARDATEATDSSRRPRHCMHQPWLTISDWPVRAFDRKRQGKEEHCLRHILCRRKFAVDGVLEHDLLDYCVLRQAQRPSLLGNLLVDEWRTDESRANDVRSYAVSSNFLRQDFCKADEPVLCGVASGLSAPPPSPALPIARRIASWVTFIPTEARESS